MAFRSCQFFTVASFVVASIVVLALGQYCNSLQSQDNPPTPSEKAANVTFMPFRSGFSGADGTELISDLDETGRHPIEGIDAFFEARPDVAYDKIVGIQLRRENSQPKVIGRTTKKAKPLDIPRNTFIAAIGINPDFGRSTDILTIFVFWESTDGHRSGNNWLGLYSDPSKLYYYYSRFPTTQFKSQYQITGMEGYVSKDNTLRSFGVVRSVRPDASTLSSDEVKDGPCGPVGGMVSLTDSTAGQRLLNLRLWSDRNGLYGIQIKHSDKDDADVQEGRIFGVKGGAPHDFPLSPTESMTSIGGKVDSTGIRVLVINIFDYATKKTRRICSTDQNDAWTRANDFMFNLPPMWSPDASLPSARIFGFHGWVKDNRITAIGPFYATTQPSAKK